MLDSRNKMRDKYGNKTAQKCLYGAFYGIGSIVSPMQNTDTGTSTFAQYKRCP